jgi:oxygen-dependent protoporphyrinogen oxidase
MNQGKQRVAIVGAGISGLAAAHRLGNLDKNLDVTVFEASEKLGGVLQTEHADGFCIEHGPDSMLSRLPLGVDLCRQIGLADELINTSESQRGVFVVFRGRLQRVPEGLAVMAPQKIWPFVTTPILSWRGKLRLAKERLIPGRRSTEDESLAAFTRRRFGRELFERLVQPLAGGIYMGDPEQLSIQAAFPQFVEMETKYGSLVKAARAGRAKGKTKSESGGPQYSLFVAPRRGLGSVVDALASQLSNCRILHNQRVNALSRRDDGWSIQVQDQPTGELRREEFAGAILAVPAYHVSSMMQEVDQEVSRLLGEIPFAGCVVVNLAYPREAIPHPLDSFGFVVPHVEQRPVLACTFSSVKYAGRAPDGKVLLRAFLGGACYPDVLEWPDEQLLQTVQDELRQLLKVNQPPVFSRIKRWRRAMPQYTLGHLQRVERIEQLVEQLPFFELAGNSYRGVGIPHCIGSGQQASDRLLAALEKESPSTDSQRSR